MKNLAVFVNSVNKNELMEMVRAYQAYVNFSYEKPTDSTSIFTTTR